MTNACLVAPRCDLAQFRTNVSEMGVDAAAADACAYVASELLDVDDERSPPVEETAEPSCNPGAAPGNVRYRWGDQAADDVSSFGVPVRSRPTAALRRVDAAVVVDAEVAQKLLSEADGVLLVLDASAELSTPWRRQSAPVEKAAFAAMDAGGPQVRVVCVTTGAGGCGALRSGAPNMAVSCVWPSSIVAGPSDVFGRRAVSRGVNASKNACVRVEICPESVFFARLPTPRARTRSRCSLRNAVGT